jgi:hypothetical protein
MQAGKTKAFRQARQAGWTDHANRQLCWWAFNSRQAAIRQTCRKTNDLLGKQKRRGQADRKEVLYISSEDVFAHEALSSLRNWKTLVCCTAGLESAKFENDYSRVAVKMLFRQRNGTPLLYFSPSFLLLFAIAPSTSAQLCIYLYCPPGWPDAPTHYEC